MLSITTTTIISDFSVLIFINFNLIPSVKVSGNSDRLPESIENTIIALRLYWNTYTPFEDYLRDECFTFYYLGLSLCPRLRNLSHDLSRPIKIVSETHSQTQSCIYALEVQNFVKRTIDGQTYRQSNLQNRSSQYEVKFLKQY